MLFFYIVEMVLNQLNRKFEITSFVSTYMGHINYTDNGSIGLLMP